MIHSATWVNSEQTENYTVHEWGTFTSVSSSDGRLMDGLYIEEEQLPLFVHEFTPFKNFMLKQHPMPKGRLHHLKGVNIKMETPVIYFYSDQERTVDVNVKFKGGIINQWYPKSVHERSTLQLGDKQIKNHLDVDFTKNYTDSIDWRVKVLPKDTHLSYTSPQNQENAGWINPRFVDANMLQIGQEREKFIFYRGLARFQQPLKVTAQNDRRITLNNQSNDSIGFAMVYEFKNQQARVWWTGSVKGNEQIIINKGNIDKDLAINKHFIDGLTTAGLYKKEAASMLETWRHSYFEKDGLRVFWIVPRKFTDKILPLKLSPTPRKLARVIVGRTEVMTPEFEHKLAGEFINNQNSLPFWYDSRTFQDRFYQAWKNRAAELNNSKIHQFSFLKNISPEELPYGDYYIKKDKKSNLHTVYRIGFSQTLMTYKTKNQKIDGEIIYYFRSAQNIKNSKELGVYYPDRKAVFNMKNGMIEGSCKIYDTVNKNKLIKTLEFKEGKIL